jgi:HAD superfamily hydrolase (TIGR01509 family)
LPGRKAKFLALALQLLRAAPLIMSFRTALFDLDGTLLDHFSAIHRSYCHTLPQLGLPAPTLQAVRNAVGGGLEQAMLRFIQPSQLTDALRIYRAYFNRTMLDDAKLFPGAIELLRALHHRGVTCAVLTNKVGGASRALCQHLGASPYLSGVFGAGDTPWLKPDPAFSQHALQTLRAEVASTVLVGDSPFDVQTGQKGGFPCWTVTTGTHNGRGTQRGGGNVRLQGLG